jgi:hypothetical protein
MARAMLVGCGCCARGAGALLAAEGWAVRGTSRGGAGLEAIAAAGLEAVAADPDRVGSVVEQLGDVTVLAWLLGDLTDAQAVATLNGPRLGSLLEKVVDTPVRGFVFEAPAGNEGLGLVEDAAARWHVPVEVVRADRSDPERWASETAGAVKRSIGL